MPDAHNSFNNLEEEWFKKAIAGLQRPGPTSPTPVICQVGLTNLCDQIKIWGVAIRFFNGDGTYCDDNDNHLAINYSQSATFRSRDETKCVKKILMLIGYVKIATGELKGHQLEWELADQTLCSMDNPVEAHCDIAGLKMKSKNPRVEFRSKEVNLNI